MARKAKEREVRLTVRVSESLVEALDHYGSSQQTAKRRKKVSRNKAVCEILEAALEDGGKALQALRLTQTHNGDIVTNRERSNGIHDPVRGDLLYAELPKALAKKAKRS